MEVVAASVEEHCKPWLSFDRPAGGFYLWLELNEGLPSTMVNEQLGARLAAACADVAARVEEGAEAPKCYPPLRWRAMGDPRALGATSHGDIASAYVRFI